MVNLLPQRLNFPWLRTAAISIMVLAIVSSVAHAQSESNDIPLDSVLVNSPVAAQPAGAAGGYRQYSAHERSALFPSPNRSAAPGDGNIVLPMHSQACGPNGYPAPEPLWMPFYYWSNRLFRHSDPNDPMRHMGVGNPLSGTSWRNRPLYAGWLVGGIWGDSLTGGVDQGDELFGGYRFGYDFDHYWGTELRVAWTNVGLEGVPNTQPQTAGHLYYDLNLLYYPWGDARWRPYAGLGLGVARFRFTDDLGSYHDEQLIGMPIQIGVKYLHEKWLAVRFDLTDNLAFGGDNVNTMNNFSISAGVEVHFGGRRRSYFPWSSTTALW